MRPEVFVGRERELATLREALEDADRGSSRVVLIAGEPGIGKTRLAEELAAGAGESGSLALWGRARETPGAPPHWPWIQVGRALAAALGTERLRSLVERDASDLQRLFPELRDLFPDLEAADVPLDQESARFRLFEAFTAVIRRVAADQAVVLLLDDLQWADVATLLLLRHVATELEGSRLLIVGAYRGGDVDRDHPLSTTLAALNRLAGFQRIALGGLSEEETAAYVQANSDLRAPASLQRRLFAATEGNPFFTREVVELLTASSTSDETGAEISLPEGVREALGRRLAPLGPEARDVLRVAAVVGREFPHETVALVAESTGVDIVSALDEAHRLRLIEATPIPGRYRFVHALMQEAVLADISAPRRAELHGQVATALERRWGQVAGRYAARLAPHVLEAAPLGPEQAGRAVHYLRLAGEQAERQYAWDEAAHWYEVCLRLVEESGAGDDADLLLALGRCHRYRSRYRAAMRSLMRAMSVFREHGDGLGVARAAAEACEITLASERHVRLAQEGIEALGDGDPHLRAVLLAQRAHWRFDDDETHAAAVAAATHDWADVEGLLLAQRTQHRTLWAGDAEASLQQGERAYELLRETDRHQLAGSAIEYATIVAVLVGDAARGEAMAARMLRFAEQRHHVKARDDALAILAFLAHLRGDYERALSLLAEATELHMTAAWLRTTIACDLGAPLPAARLPSLEGAGGIPYVLGPFHAVRAHGYYALGDVDRARDEIAGVERALPHAVGSGPWTMAPCVYAGDALPALASDSLAARLTELLERWPWARGWADRLRGRLALRLGLTEQAATAFEAGVAFAEPLGWPIEQARSLEGLAEVAERRGDPEQAQDHLQAARTIFERHGAHGRLEAVRAALERVTAKQRTEAPDGLSSRELQVLALIAGGNSNRQIAAALGLSVHTVQRHVANIYLKADLRSRAQATAYAHRHQLVDLNVSPADAT